MTSEGWIAIIASLVAGLTSAYIGIMQARAKVRSDAKQQQLSAHEIVMDRQEKQVIRQQEQINEQQEAIEKLYAAHAECREENAEIYGWVRSFHESMVYMVGEITRLGGHPSPIPDLPARNAQKAHGDSADFLRRTTAQNAELLKKVDPASRKPDDTGV